MTQMKLYSVIESFFRGQSIEYFAALRREDLCLAEGKVLDVGVKSAFVFLMPYYTGEHPDRNVSLYSVSLDYHLYVKELSVKLAAWFEKNAVDTGFRFIADASPVSEVLTAARASLGVIGKNRLLINEKYGSFVFVGTLFLEAELDSREYTQIRSPKECMGCEKCLRACPFLSGERDFCLSELNQRKRVSGEELAVIRSAPVIWGCDDCQTVCPCNRDVPVTPIEFFHRQPIEFLTAEAVKQMPAADFSERAYSWRGKRVILRNLGEDGEEF